MPVCSYGLSYFSQSKVSPYHPSVTACTGRRVCGDSRDVDSGGSMSTERLRNGSLLAALLLALLPGFALGQDTGTIAGVVKDSTGGVLPGVTVEVSSPVLIEKVRTASTDGQGQYKIVSLRPGLYEVSFSLEGFGTVKRPGIELTSAFTANVNADMKPGSLEESITVSGQSPLVDVQNTV